MRDGPATGVYFTRWRRNPAITRLQFLGNGIYNARGATVIYLLDLVRS